MFSPYLPGFLSGFSNFLPLSKKHAAGWTGYTTGVNRDGWCTLMDWGPIADTFSQIAP